MEEANTMEARDNSGGIPALEQGEPSDEKLRELILYIAWMSEDDPTFGATKLNKILFFADFEAYAQRGRAITWQEYRCMESGPAPVRLVPVRDQLTVEGALAIRETDFFGHPQQRPIALRRPDLSMFTGEDLAIVHALIQRWKGRTASEITDVSDERAGWRYAQVGDVIPYEAALLVKRSLTRDDIAWASQFEALAEAIAAGTD